MKTHTALVGASVSALIAAGGVGYGFSDPSSPVLGPLSSILGASLLGHVSNNVALSSLPSRIGRVRRDGYYAANDGGGAEYMLTSTACAAADGGSQIALTGGGCAVIDPATPLTTPIFGARCDNATNDTAAIQAALNAAATLSAQLQMVPRGKICLVANLQIPSYTHGRIDGGLVSVNGAATLISNATATASHVVLEGDGYLNNKWPVGIPQAQVLPAGVSCIQTYGAISYWTIRRLTLQDCGYWPANIVGNTAIPGAGAAHIYFDHVTAIGGNRASWEFAEGCDDCWAESIHYETTSASDIGFTFYSNIRDSGIKHSYIKGSALGIAVLSDGTANQDLTSFPSTNILIEGNEILGSKAEAIEIHHAAGGYQSNIRIIGNDGHNNNYSLQANKGGETINECDNCTSIGNHWHEDGSGSSTNTPVAGIDVYAAAKNFTSIGDVVKNEGAGGGIGIGLVLNNTGTGTNPSVQALRVEDTQTAPTMVYAVQGGCTSDCTLMGTKVVGFSNAWAGLNLNLGAATAFGNDGLTNSLQGNTLINGALILNGNNILGNNAASGYSITSDPMATISNGAAVQLNGSTSSKPGLLNLIGKSLGVNGAAAVSCSGPPTSSYTVTLGIVTHC